MIMRGGFLVHPQIPFANAWPFSREQASNTEALAALRAQTDQFTPRQHAVRRLKWRG
jgi:hypothetical protein